MFRPSVSSLLHFVIPYLVLKSFENVSPLFLIKTQNQPLNVFFFDGLRIGEEKILKPFSRKYFTKIIKMVLEISILFVKGWMLLFFRISPHKINLHIGHYRGYRGIIYDILSSILLNREQYLEHNLHDYRKKGHLADYWWHLHFSFDFLFWYFVVVQSLKGFQ